MVRALTNRNPYALSAATLLGVLFASASTITAAGHCGSFTFGKSEDDQRHVERSLARVYPADATRAADHRGAATVINLRPMLLVTAGHVAKTDTVKLSFASVSDALYETRVIARPSKPNSAASEQDAESPSADLDFAVLLVENSPTRGIEALETWFEEVNKDKSYHLAGFARDMAAPLWAKNGKLAEKSECAWRLRETTFNGDSGGAAVSENGLLVGVIISGHEGGQFDDGAMGQATVLPLNCVEDAVISAFNESAPISGTSVLDAERAQLMQELQPPPSTGWISNLEFARALRDLMANRPLLQKLQSRGAIDCPLFRSAMDRQLGYKTAIKLIKFAAKSEKDAAEILMRMGDEEKAPNTELAKRLYASAASTYTDYIGRRWPLSTSAPSDVAAASIGRADALAKLASISGDDAEIKKAAVAASAVAVEASPKGRPRGLAYARLGNLAFESGDYQTAIEAFTSAANNGFSAKWVTKDYAEAFRRRDNVLEPHKAKDYSTLGEYRPLTQDKVRELGMVFRLD